MLFLYQTPLLPLKFELPTRLAISYLAIFLLLTAACSKNSDGPVPIIYTSQLAGQRNFFVSQCDDEVCNGGWYCLSFVQALDIVVVDSTHIKLGISGDILALRIEPPNTRFFANTDNSIAISYHPGSDTVFYSRHLANRCYSSSAGGFSLLHSNQPSKYSFTYTGSTQLWDSVYFQSNAPANSSFIWDFGDGTQSTLANPAHVYNAIFHAGGKHQVSLMVKNGDNASFYSQELAVTPHISKFAGTHIWKVSYNGNSLPDTTFDVIRVDDFNIKIGDSILHSQPEIDIIYNKNARRSRFFNGNPPEDDYQNFSFDPDTNTLVLAIHTMNKITGEYSTTIYTSP